VHLIPHGSTLNPYLSTPRNRLARRLGLPSEALRRVIIALPGFLCRDKGLDILESALEALGEHANKLNIIIGGEPQGAIPEWNRDNVYIILKYLTAEEILMLSALSHAIVLPYTDPPGKYAVSGILHLVISSTKPVIESRAPRLVELQAYAPSLTFQSYNISKLILLFKK